jgi:hypothetical protein
MALNIDYTKIRRELGRFVGIGTDTTDTNAWTASVIQDLADAIENGLRRFYWPMIPVPTADGAPQKFSRYIWSFLAPNATLAVSSGTSTYNLPDDFTDMASEGFTYSANDNQPMIVRIGDEQLSALQASAPQSGPAKYYSVRAKPTAEGSPTRYDVEFYPTPAASHTLTYSYSVTPDTLSEANPYPFGAAQHSETILEACLAEAEKIFEIPNGGAHEIRFRELLTASIEFDKSLSMPDSVSVWPIEHPATTLEVNKAYLKRLIGNQMGIGPNQATWNATQIQQVKMVLETGLRKFYTPPTAEGDRRPHSWSFLRPVHTFDFESGKYIYDLPDDFAMMVGPIVYAPGSSTMYPSIDLVGERMLMKRLQFNEASTRPRLAAVRPKPPTPGMGTRYELLVWPTPDDDYEVTFRYQFSPGMLDDETALPFGGQDHMQTLIEACLAAAEESSPTGPGVHSQLFAQLLQASVMRDRDLHAPDTYGQNIDRSDSAGDPFRYSDYHSCDENIVTYNGVRY